MKKDSNTKSKSTVILIILLLLVLISLVGYNTFAKYVSSTSGEDSITAAKWSFKVNDGEIAVVGDSTTTTIELFKTIKDSNLSDDETDTSNKLAPGTSGSFDLVVQNTSEVTAKYAIALAVTGVGDIPLEYKINDGEWSNSLSSIPASDDTVLAVNSAAKTITVSWRWAYEVGDASDVNDTAVGIAAREGSLDDVKVTATITATQVD